MLLNANALDAFPLADGSVHCCITSPPYFGLRDYGVPGQLGLEETWQAYVENMVQVFREVWRVLRDDGTCWLNLGDSYTGSGKSRGGGGNGPSSAKQVTNRGAYFDNGSARLQDDQKPKDLMGIPWRVAFALQADGWYLRSDIIWNKPNPMPESVTDRPTKSHEYLFLLAKQPRYYYDAEAVKEENSSPEQLAHNQRYAKPYDAYDRRAGDTGQPGNVNNVGIHARPGGVGRNRRSVWTVATAPFAGAHFATFPPALVEPCILAGTSAHGCCAVCGAPWARVTERTDTPDTSAKGSYFDKGKTGVNGNGRVQAGERYVKVATGWAPTCDHDASTVPAIVLDPFAGSGTTGAVARLHGRRFVGLDLNAVYLRTLALPRAEGRTSAAALAELPLFQVTP